MADKFDAWWEKPDAATACEANPCDKVDTSGVTAEWFDAAMAQVREQCAKIAEDYDGEGMDGTGYDAQLGDASKTRREIAERIRALPTKKEVS